MPSFLSFFSILVVLLTMSASSTSYSIFFFYLSLALLLMVGLAYYVILYFGDEIFFCCLLVCHIYKVCDRTMDIHLWRWRFKLMISSCEVQTWMHFSSGKGWGAAKFLVLSLTSGHISCFGFCASSVPIPKVQKSTFFGQSEILEK